MKRHRALGVVLAALLGASLLAGAPAWALCDGGAGGIGGTGRGEQPAEGIGGTGLDNPGDGIGGTGRDPGDGIGGTGRDPGDGIGGTGRAPGTGHDPGDGIGGTGVFGVVSGVSPLCVGGVAVEIGPDTPVTRAGEPSELAVGQVVWALGLLSGDESAEQLLASQVEIVPALRGAIASSEADVLQVAGTPVYLAAGIPIVDARTGERLDRSQLAAGSRVEISGLRDDAGLVATRIERLGDLPRPPLVPFDLAARARGQQISRVAIEGVVTRPSAPDRVRVAGVEALLPERPARAETLRAGERVRIRARVEASGALRAVRVERVERPVRAPDRPAVPAPAPTPAPTAPERPPVPPTPAPAPAPERPERPDAGVLLERPERPVRPEVPPRPEPPVRPPERPAIERPERPDVPDKLDRPVTGIRPAPARDVRPTR